MKLALALTLCIVAPLGAGETARASEINETKAREISQTYGNCVVSQRNRVARYYILNDIADKDAMRWKDGIIVPFCLNVRSPGRWESAKFPADHYRYVLAQALFKRDLAKLPPPVLTEVPTLSHRPMPEPLDPATLPADPAKLEEMRKTLADKSIAHLADLLADCSVRRDPETAKALLVAPIGGREEEDAFKAFAPAMARCLPEGKQVRLNRTVTKGATALNYYRLAAAAGALSDKLMPTANDEPDLHTDTENGAAN